MSEYLEIVIRECASPEEFRECVAIQKSVWGFEDLDIVPVRMFVVAHKIEGGVLGAFDGTGRMVGFALAVPALHGREVYLHSHMAAVLPEFRAFGVGRRLKLEQRRRALARGIRVIEWTFDPLELGNAHFNIERLGAVARRYVVNQYGISTSPLHRGLATDRLIAEWRLDSPNVEAVAEGREPQRPAIERRISVPVERIRADASHQSMAELQLDLRKQFQQAFAEGLTVFAFARSPSEGTYLLGRWEH